MTEVTKQSSDKAKHDDTLRVFWLPDYQVSVEAHDIDEAISIAEKQASKKDEGDN
jgi:hypothetical protein